MKGKLYYYKLDNSENMESIDNNDRCNNNKMLEWL